MKMDVGVMWAAARKAQMKSTMPPKLWTGRRMWHSRDTLISVKYSQRMPKVSMAKKITKV